MKIVDDLLKIEHQAIAFKLGLVDSISEQLDYSLLLRSLGYIERLSRKNPSDKEKKIIITISALLWTYRDNEWIGLRDYLSLILARIGCAPSSIMIDEEYDRNHALFSRMQSVQAELDFLYNQLKYEVNVAGSFFLLTDFQCDVWNALGSKKIIGISAPTSAGKSFVLSLKIADILFKNDGAIVYIVPTLSLVSQVCADIKDRLKCVGMTDCSVYTNCNEKKDDKKCVFVLTQEKAINAFSEDSCLFPDVLLLVVDEIQNIERSDSESENRARILYDTLINFKHDCCPNQIVVSGPRIENIKNLGIEIFCCEDAEGIETKNSPVVGFTYSMEIDGNNRYFKQYSDLSTHPKKIDITSRRLPRFGGSQYTPKYLEHFYSFFDKIDDSGNIIFVPTSNTAEKVSKFIAGKKAECVTAEVETLASYIKRTVRDNYALADCVLHGVVYHHGKMPMHLRCVVEYAIKKGYIGNVVCTTTLMQGVNLPAKNVIMRNPYLCIKAQNGEKTQLTNYEIANLRGRAGRLMRDFIGRTFVLAEEQFEKEIEQTELFQETEKRLKPGYESVYEENRDSLKEMLLNSIDAGNDRQHFLVTYIRQSVYVYGRNSANRLRSVGISLEIGEIDRLISLMSSLSVPKEICKKNRYWDPFVLDQIYRRKEQYSLPVRVFEADLKQKMGQLIRKLQEDYSYYFEKYFVNIDNDSVFWKKIESIVDWMREQPISEILNSQYFDNPSNIDETLSFLQNKVAFGLTMLLKPFYDIICPNSMILQSIECGAYRSTTKKLIEMNVARETAISLSNSLFSDINDLDEKSIRMKINSNKDKLEFWEQVQVENI